MGTHRAARTPTVGFAAALSNRLFATLFLAEAQSTVGDQFARVALAVLVFDATGSAPATAASYAATLLPAVLGGVLLGRLGDRFSRRRVMVGCDLARAACFATMAVPGVPIGVVIGLVVFAVAFGPVFSAAQISLLASRMTTAQFRAGNALRLVAGQTAQVGGFVFGGVVVALTGPRLTLLLDGLTFVVSAILVAGLDRQQRGSFSADMPGGAAAGAPAPAAESDPTDGSDPVFVGVWRDPRLRGLMGLALLVGLFVVPEGLAVPFGDSVGASTTQIGLLFAAGAAGGALGAVAIVRLQGFADRELLAGWLAVLCGLPLTLSAVGLSWPMAALCWLVSGMCAAYMVEATTLIVQAIPDDRRAGLVGVLNSLLLASQGAGLIVFGAVSQFVATGVAIAFAGGIGSAIATVLALGPLRRGRRAAVARRAAADMPASVRQPGYMSG